MLSDEAGRYRAPLLALILAFTVYLVPGLFADTANAKEVFADQAFAEAAFAKEVNAQEEAMEEGGEPEIEWGKDVFYKDWEGILWKVL